MADAVLEQRLVVSFGALALVFLIVCGLLVLLGGCALIAKAIDRWRTASRQVDDILADIPDSPAPTVHDVGPDNLRLLEDLDAHLKAYGAAVADLYDTTREEQQEGAAP